MADKVNNNNNLMALAYLRTSSASGIGEDKDSQPRQRRAISAYAKRARYEIIAEYADEAVKGSDPIEARPGFAAMLQHIASNGVRVIIVETASRFARDLTTQELGFAYLQKLGVTLIAADRPDAFVDDTPTAVMVRQILGAVSQMERATLLRRMNAGAARKKALTGKCSGRKTYAERSPEMVALAKRLHRAGLSLRSIAADLEAAGHVQKNGRQYAAAAVMRMIGG